jgi:hypothetical protein
MFKIFVRNKYKEICTRKNFLEIREDLKNFSFNEELTLLKKRNNPLIKIVQGKSNDKYVDFGKLILTVDKFDKNHFLLIPKDLSYFNVLNMSLKDIPLLQDMKSLVSKHVGQDFVLFFHCYPYNSIHTLHLHIVESKFYVPKNNDLLIDDVIYVFQYEEILSSFFSVNSLSSINMKDAVKLCDEIFVMDYLFATGKLNKNELLFIENEIM